MTPPPRIALARAVLAVGVTAVIALASLPWVARGAIDSFHALVTALRGAGHGLLSVEDGFVTAMAVSVVTIPLPALVAVAVPTTTRRGTAWAALGTVVVIGLVAVRTPTPPVTWASLLLASAVGVLLGWLVLSALRAGLADSTSRSRRAASLLIVLYGLGVLFVGFTGSPVDAGAHPWIVRALGTAHDAGLPDWFGYAALEFSANVLFFVPLGVLLVLLLGARRWYVAAVAGLALSSAIETGQALFLPARFASLDDVLANTSGAVVGALLGVVALGCAARRNTC